MGRRGHVGGASRGWLSTNRSSALPGSVSPEAGPVRPGEGKSRHVALHRARQRHGPAFAFGCAGSCPVGWPAWVVRRECYGPRRSTRRCEVLEIVRSPTLRIGRTLNSLSEACVASTCCESGRLYRFRARSEKGVVL